MNFLYKTVENNKNGENAIVTKGRAMTYAEALRCKKAVEEQNKRILMNEPVVHKKETILF